MKFKHTKNGEGKLVWNEYFGMWKLEGPVSFCLAGNATPIPMNSDHWYANHTKAEIERSLKNKGWIEV